MNGRLARRLGVLLVAAVACARPSRPVQAPDTTLRLLRAAAPPPPRPPVPPSTGAGGYDWHPREDPASSYGYEFTDAYGDSCARFEPCDVTNAIERAARQLYPCYGLAPVPAGNYVGRLTLRLRVSPSGEVLASDVGASDTGSDDLDACVARGMRAAVFAPEAPGGANEQEDTLLTLPLTLTTSPDRSE